MNQKILALLLVAGVLVSSQASEPVREINAGVKQISTAGHAATPYKVLNMPVVEVQSKVMGEQTADMQEVPFMHILGKNTDD